MRVAFMGTPDFAVTALDALLAAGHDIVVVHTRPPRPANRGRVTRSPVQQRAEALGLAVRTPETLRSAAELAALAALRPDIGVVAAYGLLLPPDILALPRLGFLNIHASLLPRWRGAAPIQRAILAGDRSTGVTIMQMERGLDSGPMLARRETATGRKTAGELTAELAAMGADLLLEVLARPGDWQALPQPEAGVTHAARIDKAESRIDWARPASEIDRLVRAMQPSPGAWFETGGSGIGGARVKLIAAAPVAGSTAGSVAGSCAPGTLLTMAAAVATGDGALQLVAVQPAGKKPMPAAAWLRGRHLRPGDRL